MREVSLRRVPWSIALPALAVALATALQGVQLVRDVSQPRSRHLDRAIPVEVHGWSSRDVPLGPNEFLSGEVGKVLNFDDAVNRVYSRTGVEFGVYVAYWSSGKMPTRLVASHTPDRCWTENGWHCTGMQFRQAGVFRGLSLQPAEARVFEPPQGGAPTYVLFWLLVDGKAYDFGERFTAIPSPVLWIEDAFREALAGSGEQYFVRITSSVPVETLEDDAGFATVLRSLEDIGISSLPQTSHGDRTTVTAKR